MIKKPKNNIPKRRYNLWIRDPHCHWCNRELEWLETTVDHINQKTKNKKRPKVGVRVLACHPCNNQRQIDAFNEMNKIQQWLRDGNIPPVRRIWGPRKTPIYARIWLLYYHLTKKK